MADKARQPERPIINDEAIYNPTATAELLDVTPRFLQHDRSTRRLIPFVKIGRFVRYRGIDLRGVIESNIVGGVQHEQ